MKTRRLRFTGRRCMSCGARTERNRAVCVKCRARVLYVRRRTYPDATDDL